MDVSIVIPVYNRREYLEKTVLGIVASGVRPRNVVLVDNGSTDGSLELIETFPDRFGPSFVVLREPEPGAAAARNRGLAACTGKWIYFFDSDDVFTGLPETWDESADMVCFPTTMCVDGRATERVFIPRPEPHVQILSLSLNTQGMIFNADFLRRAGGWDNRCRIWNDWELGIRCLSQARNVQFLTEKAYHRILVHPDSITGPDFSSRHDRLGESLEVVRQDVQAISNPVEKEKCRRALYFRLCILCGHYLKEGNARYARELEQRLGTDPKPGRMDSLVGRCLRRYVALGGRGAWRIALKIADRKPGR